MHTSVIMTAIPANSAENFHQRDEPYDVWALNHASTPSNREQNHTQSYKQVAFDSKVNANDVNISDTKEKSKKDKKWSLGKLFRRKKKSDDSEISSESDDGCNTRNKAKRKRHKKKRPVKKVNDFEHIAFNDKRRAQSLVKPSYHAYVDEEIFSDPTNDVITFRNRGVPQVPVKEIKDDFGIKSANTSLDGSLRKNRKDRMKARAEAIRNSLIKDSSSDEESKTSSTSSVKKVKSDDSLVNGSWSKKSRGARTERYIKRLSRDDEHQLNKEAELMHQGYSKAEVELLTRTPTSQSSGYGTCKRERIYANATHGENIYANDISKLPKKSESVSSFPARQNYSSAINFNGKVNNEPVHYSIPLRNQNRSFNYKYTNGCINNNDLNNVLNITFPLGNLTNIKKGFKEPPAPPPRDLNRVLNTPVSFTSNNNENKVQNVNKTIGIPNDDFQRIMRRSHDRNMNLRRPISNSVDHIQFYPGQIDRKQPKRPASVSAEPNHLYGNTQWNVKPDILNSIYRPEPTPFKQDYLYYADQRPRSRRPISIQPDMMNQEKKLSGNIEPKPKTASEFWRKLDQEQYSSQNEMSNRVGSESEFLSNARNLRNFQKKNEFIRAKTENPISHLKVYDKPREFDEVDRAVTYVKPSHARHKSESQVQAPPTSFLKSKSPERRKSSNLDDALRELETIYNSLGLGDEDLLDRAERRELMSPIVNKKFDELNGDIMQYSHPKKKPMVPRRSTLPDKLQDDMAYRRLNAKDKPITKTNSTSQISYMLASPVFIPYTSDEDRYSEIDNNEPDIVLDDVVYRNIKQTNNRLKVADPQPPFGIPLGPISPAPSSDYLHATPELTRRSRFVPRRSPDIVSDDLAYRSLRKDKIDDLPHLKINNSILNEALYSRDSALNSKKKRAVRSLSANIFTMVQKEIDDALNMSKLATVQKTNSNNNVIGIANNVHSDPKNKIKQRNNTVNIFASDSHPATLEFVKDELSAKHRLARPPSGEKSKTSSPKARSPVLSQKSDKEEFQQVLSLLAQEAMDTSNRLGVALAEIDKNRNKQPVSLPQAIGQNIIDRREIEPDVKLVSIHSEIVDDSKNQTFGFSKNNMQEPIKQIYNDENALETEQQNEKFKPNISDIRPIRVPLKFQENLKSNSKEKIEELDSLKKFKQIESCVTNIIDGMLQVNDPSIQGNEEIKDAKNIISVCDEVKQKKDNTDVSEYNSSEELAIIFTAPDGKNQNNVKDKHSDLNSPKLVKNVNQQLREMSIDRQEQGSSSANNSIEVPWRKKRPDVETQEPKDNQRNESSSKSLWYNQPSTIMLACTYTLLYTYNLAELDWLTLLGLILAMISIIAMLII